MPAKKTTAKRKPGKKPETLKIEGNWKDAIKKALTKPVSQPGK